MATPAPTRVPRDSIRLAVSHALRISRAAPIPEDAYRDLRASEAFEDVPAQLDAIREAVRSCLRSCVEGLDDESDKQVARILLQDIGTVPERAKEIGDLSGSSPRVGRRRMEEVLVRLEIAMGEELNRPPRRRKPNWSAVQGIAAVITLVVAVIGVVVAVLTLRSDQPSESEAPPSSEGSTDGLPSARRAPGLHAVAVRSQPSVDAAPVDLVDQDVFQLRCRHRIDQVPGDDSSNLLWYFSETPQRGWVDGGDFDDPQISDQSIGFPECPILENGSVLPTPISFDEYIDLLDQSCSAAASSIERWTEQMFNVAAGSLGSTEAASVFQGFADWLKTGTEIFDYPLDQVARRNSIDVVGEPYELLIERLEARARTLEAADDDSLPAYVPNETFEDLQSMLGIAEDLVERGAANCAAPQG